MQPYVIRQGDFLAKLAHRFGFDADTVWNDAANTKLGDARTDPNILAPTDILYIPDDAGSSRSGARAHGRSDEHFRLGIRPKSRSR